MSFVMGAVVTAMLFLGFWPRTVRVTDWPDAPPKRGQEPDWLLRERRAHQAALGRERTVQDAVREAVQLRANTLAAQVAEHEVLMRDAADQIRDLTRLDQGGR